MKKFMVLYEAPVSAREQLGQATPEQAQAGMQAWMQWQEKAGDAVVDFGMPLAAGKRLENASIDQSRSAVGGYSIIQAESLDDAVELLKDHPHFLTPGGASIEVLEFLPIPGM
jgi:hypothetical protein